MVFALRFVMDVPVQLRTLPDGLRPSFARPRGYRGEGHGATGGRGSEFSGVGVFSGPKSNGGRSKCGGRSCSSDLRKSIHLRCSSKALYQAGSG